MHDGRSEGHEALEEIRGLHPVTTLLIVMAAGAVGVGLRYVLDALITSHAGADFPWSTLAINISGALVLGVLVGALPSFDMPGALLRPAAAAGLLGGFTTFSAFALEAVSLAEDGFIARAAVYVAATNVAGIAATVGGLAVGRAL